MRDKLDSLEKELDSLLAEYTRLSADLNLWRGKVIGEDVEVVNSLLGDIQRVFIKCYPVLAFIVNRNQSCLLLIKEYDRFINDIKTAGAQEIKEVIN